MGMVPIGECLRVGVIEAGTTPILRSSVVVDRFDALDIREFTDPEDLPTGLHLLFVGCDPTTPGIGEMHRELARRSHPTVVAVPTHDESLVDSALAAGAGVLVHESVDDAIDTLLFHCLLGAIPLDGVFDITQSHARFIAGPTLEQLRYIAPMEADEPLRRLAGSPGSIREQLDVAGQEQLDLLLAGELRDVTLETSIDDNAHARAIEIELRREGGAESPHLVGLIEDVTEQREREASIAEAKEVAAAETARIETFASTVSHDLRNPLTVAQGRLELAAREVESEHLAAVDRAHARIEQLTDALVEWARIGRGSEELAPVDIGEAVREAWGVVSAEAATVELIDEAHILADSERIRRLLEELFHNAVQHGGDGTSVRVGRMSDHLFVEDTGAGFEASPVERALEPGYTTDPTAAGFGLSIVSEIARFHGWAVVLTTGEAGGGRIEIGPVQFLDGS